jgi:hypothetical protein
VPGEKGITLRWLLRVAFGRWSVERCFRVAKDELGMDHYQVRGRPRIPLAAAPCAIASYRGHPITCCVRQNSLGNIAADC